MTWAKQAPVIYTTSTTKEARGLVNQQENLLVRNRFRRKSRQPFPPLSSQARSMKCEKE